MKVTCVRCRRPVAVAAERWPGDVVKCGGCGAEIDVADVRPPTDFGEGPIPAAGLDFGPYRIDMILGKGGMGTVFRGMHTALERPVAIKVLRPSLAHNPKFVQRFKREARALANLTHPNIVKIHDVGLLGEVHYFVMELVDGANLREILRLKRLIPGEILHILLQVCSAIDYAHKKGVIHRDLKPENIIVDPTGVAKVTDFGLAKILAVNGRAKQGFTTTKLSMGTPNYMSPEQKESMRRVDHRADIYSLGVILYEMITGDVPAADGAVPPSRKAGVNPAVDDVVARALEQKPARRYACVSDFASDVAHSL